MRVWRRLLVAIVACLIWVTPAWANTFKVTRTDDPTTGSCGPSSCSLRQAVTVANAFGGADKILLPAGTYHLTQGQLMSADSLTIVGAGPASTVITGSTQSGPASLDRAGAIVSTDSLTVEHLSISGNTATANTPTTHVTGAAGGIDEDGGRLSLLDTVVSNNTLSAEVTSGAAGVLVNLGRLNTVNSTISGNSATNGGTVVAGGILVSNASGNSTITGSTISGNHEATSSATVGAVGGVRANLSELSLINSTVSGNSAGGTGTASDRVGGVSILGADFTAENATIASNASSGPGDQAGNLSPDGSNTEVLQNSIVANGSSANATNCDSPLISARGNVETTNQCGLGAPPGDQPNTDPHLEPLQNNGGPTQTRALPLTSPAVDDAIPGLDCLSTDQRGVLRPQGVSCDSGAYEAGPPEELAAPALSGTPQVGRTLTCTPGTWRGATSFAFRWLRNGNPIAGAKASSYRLVKADAGTAVQCQVIATNVDGSTVVVSAPRGVSAIPLPVNHKLPSIVGKLRVGKTVTCRPGSWSGKPKFSFAWLRNGKTIKHAGRPKYRIAAGDAGHALQCKVTARGSGGSVSALSAPKVPARKH